MRKVKSTIQTQRIRRAFRVRAKVRGTSERPRLSVFRSNRFTVAQLIDDVVGKTLVAASSREFNGKSAKIPVAALVGKAIAERAKKAGIAKAVADRGPYRYHGRVKSLVEAARAEGLSI
ncbi:MAG: 50S ribosomal protein L18 [Candidatus Brennerbacteria bacterium]